MYTDPTGAALSAGNLVRVYGIGRVGKAVKVYSVYTAGGGALTGMQVTMAAAGNVDLGSGGTTVTGTTTVTSNGSLTGNSGTYNGTSFAAAGTTTISGGTGTGTRLSNQNARTLPDSHVFDWYTQNGTSIPISSVPGTSTKTLKYRLFSPGCNPFGGATNSYGVYVIDCQNTVIQVAYCRVVGTLVLLNVGAGSTVQNSNYFAPSSAYPNYPVLLVKGSIAVNTTATALADNLATGDLNVLSVNYNPTSTPYNGVSDTTYSTTYPSEIDGLVYVSGNLTTSNAPTFKGIVLVGGTVTVSGTLNLTYDATSYNTPPPASPTTAPSPPRPAPGAGRRPRSDQGMRVRRPPFPSRRCEPVRTGVIRNPVDSCAAAVRSRKRLRGTAGA